MTKLLTATALLIALIAPANATGVPREVQGTWCVEPSESTDVTSAGENGDTTLRRCPLKFNPGIIIKAGGNVRYFGRQCYATGEGSKRVGKYFITVRCPGESDRKLKWVGADYLGNEFAVWKY